MTVKSSEIERIIRDNDGNYSKLKVSPLSAGVVAEDFLPDELDFPNACRYMIQSEIQPDGLRETVLIHDMALKEAAVVKLKKIHGIIDPWDNDFETYLAKWRKRKAQMTQNDPLEIERLRAEYLRKAKTK